MTRTTAFALLALMAALMPATAEAQVRTASVGAQLAETADTLVEIESNLRKYLAKHPPVQSLDLVGLTVHVGLSGVPTSLHLDVDTFVTGSGPAERVGLAMPALVETLASWASTEHLPAADGDLAAEAFLGDSSFRVTVWNYRGRHRTTVPVTRSAGPLFGTDARAR